MNNNEKTELEILKDKLASKNVEIRELEDYLLQVLSDYKELVCKNCFLIGHDIKCLELQKEIREWEK